MKIDEKAIRKLADLLEETGLTEIEVAEGEQSIRINKGGTYIPPSNGGVSMPSDSATSQTAHSDAPQTTTMDNHPGAVSSPMVGTVYMASEPGAAAFIQKGTQVAQGDTLIIIEAMKVMNPIKAPRAGTVTHIAVDNGQPVEFGDVLVVIE